MERDLSDLMATLFVDMSKLAMSSVAAAVSVAAVIGLGISAPVWAIVVLGIGAGVAAGVVPDWLDSELNIIGRTKALFDRIGDRLDPEMTSFEAEHPARVMGVPPPRGF